MGRSYLTYVDKTPEHLPILSLFTLENTRVRCCWVNHVDRSISALRYTIPWVAWWQVQLTPTRYTRAGCTLYVVLCPGIVNCTPGQRGWIPTSKSTSETQPRAVRVKNMIWKQRRNVWASYWLGATTCGLRVGGLTATLGSGQKLVLPLYRATRLIRIAGQVC
ncbi:hypothetical protein BDW69DRAFT_178339 [Aspergillus filifer]